jgi:two-component system NtrC family sensor kinase
MMNELNTRVLIVDDEEIVRDSVRAILCPQRRSYSALDAASAQLFGDSQPVATRRTIDTLHVHLDEARNGREAVAAVERAFVAGQPYALILLDMRMPGWDGLTTAQKIRAIDRQVEILFITAYSDHAIQDVIERAGPDVGYLCKPFVAEEIHQLAVKSIYDWNRLRNLEALIRVVSRLRITDGQLDTLLQNIFDQAVSWLGAQSAMLIALENEAPEIRFSTGSLQQREFAQSCLAQVAPLYGSDKYQQMQDLAYFPFEKCALVVHEEGGVRLSTERTYLFLLFLEHSSQAVENARLHQVLMTKEKLSALGQAMGYVVHDLRSPIGIIMNTIEAARDEAGAPASDDLLDVIEEAAENAIAIVNDLLDFTRERPLSKDRCTLDDLLSRLSRSMQLRLEQSGVRLELDGMRAHALFCDARKMHRVLENLASNAVEALVGARTAEPLVRVNATIKGELAIFAIQDNGPGIPAELQSRLFEPFATFGKAHGTGLGLAIVRQIVEAHGGHIHVDSSPRGTSFVIEIPHGLNAG